MITRIVRMHFRSTEVSQFLTIFEQSKEKIRAFEGCLFLSLQKDTSNEAIFYTLSRWASEDHLNQYRHSELFKTTWAKTKVLFEEKPTAFSFQEV